jgi:hypothetical protein
MLREKEVPGAAVRTATGAKENGKKGQEITTPVAAPQAPVYLVRLRPEHGDGIRELRALLKIVSVEEANGDRGASGPLARALDTIAGERGP